MLKVGKLRIRVRETEVLLRVRFRLEQNTTIHDREDHYDHFQKYDSRLSHVQGLHVS